MQTTTKTNVLITEDRNGWRWGFTPQAEIWNGRLAMLGISITVLVQLSLSKGFTHF